MMKPNRAQYRGKNPILQGRLISIWEIDIIADQYTIQFDNCIRRFKIPAIILYSSFQIYNGTTLPYKRRSEDWFLDLLGDVCDRHLQKKS